METRKFRPIKIEQRAHIDGFVSVIDAMTVRQKYWEECGELLKTPHRKESERYQILRLSFHGKELRYIDSYFKMLNGYSPTFTSYSGGVYEMDLTRTAVNNFATHCSKLKPEITGSALKHLEKHYSISLTISWILQSLLSGLRPT